MRKVSIKGAEKLNGGVFNACTRQRVVHDVPRSFFKYRLGGGKKKKRRQAERPEIILLGSLHLSRTKPRLVTYICHLIMPFFFSFISE